MLTHHATEPTVIEAVAAFCARHPGVEPLTRRAAALVNEAFSEIQSLTLEAAQDPEEDAEWLRLSVVARMPDAELREANQAYLARWVAETPAEFRLLLVLRYGAE